MKKYTEMTRDELAKELEVVGKKYNELKNKGLKLDISRGKPGREQLDLVTDMLTVVNENTDFMCDGQDVRNYGILDGISPVKELFADVLGTNPENIFVGGNASLQLMYDTIALGYTHGMLNSEKPWGKLEKVKWLCPAPGYDRHFAVSESFGMEMIVVPMTDEGPDMDKVEELVKDPEVKGIWCVPKYSNPDGIIYSERTIERIANLKPAAPDFTIMWDNAYVIHEFEGDYVPFPDILSICEKAENPNIVFEFASTSKITFPGAGVAVFATSEENMKHVKKIWSAHTIGFDKINMLRHALYIKDKESLLKLMKKHAGVLGPKFRTVLDMLEKEIEPLGIAEWQKPKGGYFVSINCMPGTATEVWKLCKEAGVVMTGAGATYPYGKDPEDSNLRIAPSLPLPEVVGEAMEVFCVSLKLAALKKLLGK
ncbi:MAG: aminotransferase class I/II-fold pyridoxal phosphate-dependent enzyme [Firmicutes bacterium]|nr:aminotransferase class I/II-fold pyridoxal phosphate-dependent enzyme [Bacillota bacterium]